MTSYNVIIQMKAINQYFLVVLCESVDKNLKCGHPNDNY